jgi:hypothetical protein
MIDDLALLTPDPMRAERVRSQCQRRLEQSRRARQHHVAPKPPLVPARTWEGAIVCGVFVIYVSAVVRTALQVIAGH